MSASADPRYMARALQLAARGAVSATPNPQVGCVIVAGQEIVGEGFHLRAGGDHAEIVALKQAGERARGATAYVTLEPCAHHGRTGPCCEALIEAGVARVVVAIEDANPAVAGRGLAALRNAGIDVETGVMAAAATELNRGFLRRIANGGPRIQLKIAASLDGRTAMASGESQWITGPAARADVQQLRARSCAIVTGVGTVLADNPRLTVRDVRAADGGLRQPLRVIIDSQLRTPVQSNVISEDGEVLLLCSAGVADERRAALELAGASVIELPACADGVDLTALPAVLAQAGCNEVLLECGATLAGAMVRQQLVDVIWLYMAPQLLGSTARPLLDLPIAEMADKLRLCIDEVRHVGNDLRLRLLPEYADNE